MDGQRARQWLLDGRFTDLFIDELGWDRHGQTVNVHADGTNYQLSAVAAKRGFGVFRCAGLPDSATRREIDTQLTKTVREHLLIFRDDAGGEQVWLWVRRELGRAPRPREWRLRAKQTGEALWQRLRYVSFTLDQEDDLTLADVSAAMGEAFDVEPVTRRFYDRFRGERDAFAAFLSGIPDEGLHRWYVSVMLNRLMFIWFVQQKGFLADDPRYLHNKLGQSPGPDRFYRDFLCPLFFEGFAKQPADRDPAIAARLGAVPYLNGGLFLRHQVEELHGDTITIADAAFARLFTFFDEYRWHLDERPVSAQNEINPDVLGYIFEKYINQKQMGAYYTKEDITEYIAKSTIIPFLCDAAQRACEVAFAPDGPVCRLLSADPDAYLYDAVRHGVDRPLPDYIAAGLRDVAQRGRWNEAAPPEFALPTEIWREVVARRQRYEEVWLKLAGGEVTAVNDLITYNLDLRRFAADVIESCEGPDLLWAFWQALDRVTVLDPTCGSGAFLFAALNILEPLYDRCLRRMALFLAEWRASGRSPDAAYASRFEQVLARIDAHPNHRYFVLKSIVVNNLFGVDIMDEAVEICKLRLFLKLVAQVERVDQLEPLPDIDFNIRAGNTLVGYATDTEVEYCRFDYEGRAASLRAAAAKLARDLDWYRELQTEWAVAAGTLAEAKEKVRRQRAALADELDRYLATAYGVDPTDAPAFAAWRSSHQPFHWYVEFFAAMDRRGFDVIIGNPPYVAYPLTDAEYRVRGFSTEACGNLYAMTVERSLALSSDTSRVGLIVPLSLTFSRDFVALRTMLRRSGSLLVHSSFDNVPDRAFTGAKVSANTSKNNQQRVTIFLLDRAAGDQRVFSTPILRWRAFERPRLFQQLPLTDVSDVTTDNDFPKTGDRRLVDFLRLWQKGRPRLGTLLATTGAHRLVVPRTAGYYIAAYPDELDRTKQMQLRFADPRAEDLALVLLNSNVFFWFWRVYGDGFDVTNAVVEQCPVFKPADGQYRSTAERLRGALSACTVYKGYRGARVPNVNFNQRMDILVEVDQWIIDAVAPDLGLSPMDFLWAKSNSFLSLDVPKAANWPAGWPDAPTGEHTGSSDPS